MEAQPQHEHHQQAIIPSCDIWLPRPTLAAALAQAATEWQQPLDLLLLAPVPARLVVGASEKILPVWDTQNSRSFLIFSKSSFYFYLRNF